MEAKDYLWIGASLLTLYLASTKAWAEPPNFLKEDLEKAGAIYNESTNQVTLPEFRLAIYPEEPKPDAKYYPWYEDGKIKFTIENLGDQNTYFIYLNLRVDYPFWTQVIITALSSIFPPLIVISYGYNWFIADVIKSTLGKEYIELTLNKGEKRTIEIYFPWARFSLPLPFAYVSQALTITIKDRFGRSTAKEIRYTIGYP